MKRAAALACCALGLLAWLGCGKGLDDIGAFACARDNSCPDGFICLDLLCQRSLNCDPVNPTPGCPSDKSRCTVVRAGVSNSSGFVPQCVTNAGTQAAGEVCFAPQSGLYTTADGCGAVLLCYNEGTALGALETNNHCRRFCGSNADCGVGGGCAQAFPSPDFATLGTLGVCEPICLVFASDCQATANSHCDVLPALNATAGVTFCRDNGPGTKGALCATQNCGSGLICVPAVRSEITAPTCLVACDASHPCAQGSCDTASYPIAGGLGFCR